MQIHAAAARGDVEAVQFCLSRGVSINTRDKQGNTPLFSALKAASAFKRNKVSVPKLETFRFLLDAGADVNARCHLGQTPAGAAAATGKPDIVAFLSDRGSDFRRVTKSGYSTLVYACLQPPSAAKLETIRILARLGVSLDLGSEHGESPISVSLRDGDIDALRLLLDLGASTDALGWNAVHEAVVSENAQSIRAMRPSNEDLSCKLPRWDLTPFMLAVKVGELDKVECLASLGSDLNSIARCGARALHIAASCDRLGVLEWLLKSGAEIESVNEFGDTALMIACEGDSLRCVRSLIQNGANVHSEDGVGMQAISHARSLEALKALVEIGRADANFADGCGDWPLKNAAADNDIPRLEWLINRGAEVDLTSTGLTALHDAVFYDAREAASFLIESGASMNTQDVDGWTPLFGAPSREMILLLLSRGADPSIPDLIGRMPSDVIEDPLLTELLG